MNVTLGRVLGGIAPAILAATVLVASSCTPSRTEKTDQGGAEPAAGSPDGAAAKKAPAAAGPGPGANESGVPPALKELQERIQPPGHAPPPQPDEKTLLARAAETCRQFAAALAGGDAAAAEAFLFTREDFQSMIQPGHRSILEGTIRAQNGALTAKLVETLKGKTVQSTLRPGELTRSGTKGIFLGDYPVLGTSILALDVDGVLVEVRLDQLVHSEKGWRIFRISLP